MTISYEDPTPFSVDWSGSGCAYGQERDPRILDEVLHYDWAWDTDPGYYVFSAFNGTGTEPIGFATTTLNSALYCSPRDFQKMDISLRLPILPPWFNTSALPPLLVGIITELTASQTQPSYVASLLLDSPDFWSNLQQIYCLNPSPDDDCRIWNLCPQPDVSGTITQKLLTTPSQANIHGFAQVYLSLLYLSDQVFVPCPPHV
jgi:hypothetical protein